MLELAMHPGESVSLREISKQWRISDGYLEQLMIPLKKTGLVRSKRGARGGYSLARPADEISVGEILQSLEGPVVPRECLEHPTDCRFSSRCVLMEVWRDLQEVVIKALSSISLSDLCDKQRKVRTDGRAMYQI